MSNSQITACRQKHRHFTNSKVRGTQLRNRTQYMATKRHDESLLQWCLSNRDSLMHTTRHGRKQRISDTSIRIHTQLDTRANRYPQHAMPDTKRKTGNTYAAHHIYPSPYSAMCWFTRMDAANKQTHAPQRHTRTCPPVELRRIGLSCLLAVRLLDRECVRDCGDDTMRTSCSCSSVWEAVARATKDSSSKESVRYSTCSC